MSCGSDGKDLEDAEVCRSSWGRVGVRRTGARREGNRSEPWKLERAPAVLIGVVCGLGPGGTNWGMGAWDPGPVNRDVTDH